MTGERPGPPPPGEPSAVVVVGAGQGGMQVALGLRQRGFTGTVTVIDTEPDLPYQRPPLSKAYLVDRTRTVPLGARPEQHYVERDIALLRGTSVEGLDRDDRSVVLADGRRVPYDHLVLATGAEPIQLGGAAWLGDDAVMTLRTRTDADALAARLRPGHRLVAIGGGFIGLEVAASARGLGVEVTVVEARDRVLARVLSEPVAAHLVATHDRHGTRIRTGVGVRAIERRADGAVQVRLSDGTRLVADSVLVGVGARPRTALAEAAGLEVADGVVVDAHLATGDPRISAIGDCASFPCLTTGRRLRLESVQNAVDQARTVVARLVGEPREHAATPLFWTVQHDARVQIAGITAGHDELEVQGDPATGSFSVLCFRAGRLLGAESVNRPADHVAIRRQLERPGRGPRRPTSRRA